MSGGPGADLLVAGGAVVTMDAAGTVLECGAVAIRGAEIVAIGPAAVIEERFAGAAPEVIDAAGMAVIPGLADVHCHGADSLFRGLVDDLPLEPWLERLWEVERRTLGPATVRAGSRLAYAELLLGGVTTVLDMFWFPEAVAEAAVEAGIRVVTGPCLFDSPAVDRRSEEERLARGREFLEHYRRHPRITPCVLPHGAYTVSPALLAEARRLAQEFGVLMSTHASETTAEVATVRERYGCSPPRHLDALGLLDGPALLAHGVQLAPDEIELLAERGTAVAHCPLSNLKLGSGVAPVPALRAAGVEVGLGTDGPVSGNDLDMWLAMRLAAVLHKGVHRDPALLPAREVLALATRDGAAALGLGDRVGSLEAGKRADLAVVDLGGAHLAPRYDLLSHLVYAAGRADVDTVVVDGRVVVRHRRLETLDLAAAIAEVEEVARRVAAGEDQTGRR